MKNFEEFYNEIQKNEVLKDAFKTASKAEESIKAFLEEHDVEDSVEDFIKKFTEKQHELKELSDDELEKVAGGNFLSDIGSWAASVAQEMLGYKCT